jgi:hypothetical protein
MDQHDARRAALKGVIERVTSWQETAPDDTVQDELDRGLAEAGVTLTQEQKDDVVQRISAGDAVDLDELNAASEAGGPA